MTYEVRREQPGPALRDRRLGRVADQSLADPVQGGQEPRVARTGELDQRHHQQRRVQRGAAEVQDVCPAVRVPALPLYSLVGGIGYARQWAMGAGSARWRPILIGRSNATHVITAEYVPRCRRRGVPVLDFGEARGPEPARDGNSGPFGTSTPRRTIATSVAGWGTNAPMPRVVRPGSLRSAASKSRTASRQPRTSATGTPWREGRRRGAAHQPGFTLPEFSRSYRPIAIGRTQPLRRLGYALVLTCRLVRNPNLQPGQLLASRFLKQLSASNR